MGTTKDIRDAVEAELEFDPLVDDADIHAVNMNGDVALNGTARHVHTWAERGAVVSAAWMACGVMKVHDDPNISG